MQILGDKPVIRHTYDNTVATGLFDSVWVVTDHESILDEIIKSGGQALLSGRTHESGSDRIAEAIEGIDADIIVNVQGDEPFISGTQLRDLISAFREEGVQVASLMKKITSEEALQNPNIVKLVTRKSGDALYFSRSVIPYKRDNIANLAYFEHIGVYAYRKQALLNFTGWEQSPAEKAEMLEQLRYLHHGVNIRMVETDEAAVKIDVPEDLAKAEAYLSIYNQKKI